MLRAGMLLVAALLVLPAASAGSASGSFLAAGETRMPDGAQWQAAPLAILGDDASGMADLVLTAPRLRVQLFESEHVLVRTPFDAVGTSFENRSATYTLEDVILRLSGTATDGFVAIYPREGGRATLLAAGPSVVTPGRDGDLATAQGEPAISKDPYASREQARLVIDQPHALSVASGTLVHEGPLLLKFKGLRLEGRAAERPVTFDARREESALPVGHSIVRWAIVEADDARLEARADTAWQAAWPEADLAWTGEMSFFPVQGKLETGGVAYPASGSIVTVDGRFAGTFSVLEDASGRVLASLSLDGDVARTSLVAQEAAPPAPMPRLGGVLVAILAGVGMTGVGFTAGSLYGRRRRPHRPTAPLPAPVPIQVPASISMPFSAEDCCDAGAKAASEEDWGTAAKWFGRARKLAPTSARVCADLAFSLSQIGDVEEALRMYEESSRLSQDGEADFNGALAALHGARPLGEIEEWLERALARSPMLVMPLEADDDFKALHGRTRYEHAVGRAWQALARRGQQGDASGTA